MTRTDLHTLVTEKLDLQWSDWSAKHPNLAQAIDRVRLVEGAVNLLRDDPSFITAMREADLDEAGLVRASRLLERADALIHNLLPG